MNDPRPGLLQRTFRSLHNHNYRLFFFGQVVSMTGTWMQSVAQNWLVLQLSGSSLDLGITVGLQFGPVLFLGAWAGVLADRVDKRRLLIVTQSVAAVLALVLGVLAATGVVTVWMIWVLAGLTGCAVALDMPSRQSFVYEMVGPDDLANAIGLNAVIINTTRILGPALGALLIAGLGVAPCFFFNAISFVAVIVALVVMRPGELQPSKPVKREPGQVRAGLKYVWRTPELRVPLVMMAVVSTLAYNYSVVLPLLTKSVYGRGGGAYGLLSAAMGSRRAGRRAASGEQGATLPPHAGGQRDGARRSDAWSGGCAGLHCGPCPPGADRRRGHPLHQQHQLPAAAQRRGLHERARHGPLVGRVPRQHTHRGSAHGSPGKRPGRALGRRDRGRRRHDDGLCAFVALRRRRVREGATESPACLPDGPAAGDALCEAVEVGVPPATADRGGVAGWAQAQSSGSPAVADVVHSGRRGRGPATQRGDECFSRAT